MRNRSMTNSNIYIPIVNVFKLIDPLIITQHYWRSKKVEIVLRCVCNDLGKQRTSTIKGIIMNQWLDNKDILKRETGVTKPSCDFYVTLRLTTSYDI